MPTPAFKKTQKQIEAIALMVAHKFTLMVGGSRSGKTFNAIRAILIRACRVPSRHLIARYRFNHVKASVIHDSLPKVLKICFPELKTHMNKSDWFLELPNDSQIWFGGLDDKERVEKILGNEYSTILIEEASQMPWLGMPLIFTRLAENSGLSLRAYLTCNPPAVKHWTHKVCIEGIYPGREEPIPDFEEDYAHIYMNPYDNIENLPPGYVKSLEALPSRAKERFFHGRFQTDVDGALWQYDWFREAERPEDMARIVVAIDPAVTSSESSDETGIIVAAKKKIIVDGEDVDAYYILEDVSGRYTPTQWAVEAIKAYKHWHADKIVGETNNGGDMIEAVLRNVDNSINFGKLTASRGKVIRAEPIAALYEKGQVYHVGRFPDLEDQMASFTFDYDRARDGSPDRLDAAVWALSELSAGYHSEWFAV